VSSREQDLARDWLEQSWGAVHRWGSGGVFPNFLDPDLADWAHAYHGVNYERLTRVRPGTTQTTSSIHQLLPPA
jgi:Berberine and berberine like